MLYLIAAMASRSSAIGYNNTLPWTIKEDLAFFKEMTKGHAVIMGRKTLDSIGRALPGRLNVVITRDLSDKQNSDNVIYVDNIEAAIEAAKAYSADSYVIGGAEIYELAMPYVDAMYITEVYMNRFNPKYDSYFPVHLLTGWGITSVVRPSSLSKETRIGFRILKLEKIPNDIKHDLNENRWYFMPKVLGGNYQKGVGATRVRAENALELPKAGIKVPFLKTTFVFPTNVNTISETYLQRYLKYRWDHGFMERPLSTTFEIKSESLDVSVPTQVINRFMTALRGAVAAHKTELGRK